MAANGIPLHGKLVIQIGSQAADSLTLHLSETESWVIGRSDSKSSYLPDIDLARYNALTRGVSRRHAALVRYRGGLHVVDLSSANGTFVNGERLQAETPCLLRSGDKLLLGNFNLTFTHFE